jgi:hypothetical protein
MAEPDNLVLELLRSIRTDMGKMAESMQSLSVEMTAMRHHLAGVVTIQDHDHGDIAAIKVRLDRIERRLELADQ